MQKERIGYKHEIFSRIVIQNQWEGLRVKEEKHSVGEAHNDSSFRLGQAARIPVVSVAPTLPTQRRSLEYDPHLQPSIYYFWNGILPTFYMRDS